MLEDLLTTVVRSRSLEGHFIICLKQGKKKKALNRRASCSPSVLQPPACSSGLGRPGWAWGRIRQGPGPGALPVAAREVGQCQGHQRWHRLLSQAGGGSLARGACSRAGGAQGDRGGQRAGPGQNAAKGKWMESPAGTFAATLHPSKNPAGPIQMGLPCAPCRAPGAWQSRGPGQCPLWAHGAGPGQRGVTGPQPPAPHQQPGRPSPAGRRWPGPGGCRNSWLQLLGTRCPPQGPSADGRARPWGRVTGGCFCSLTASLRWDGRMDRGAVPRRRSEGPVCCWGQAPPCPVLSLPRCPCPRSHFGQVPAMEIKEQTRKPPVSPRLPPGNFPWERWAKQTGDFPFPHLPPPSPQVTPVFCGEIPLLYLQASPR